MAKHGDIFWNECITGDADASKAFYGGLLDWEMMDGPMPDGTGRYIIAKRGEEMICGIFPVGPDGPPMPQQWMTYLAVDDADAAAKKVAELGGEVLQGPFDIEGVGRFLMIKDPNGTVVGLAQDAS